MTLRQRIEEIFRGHISKGELDEIMAEVRKVIGEEEKPSRFESIFGIPPHYEIRNQFRKEMLEKMQ